MSERFKGMFLPHGQPLSAVATLKLPELAAVLDRVACHGVDEFYHGNISEEIAVTVGLYFITHLSIHLLFSGIVSFKFRKDPRHLHHNSEVSKPSAQVRHKHGTAFKKREMIYVINIKK